MNRNKSPSPAKGGRSNKSKSPSPAKGRKADETRSLLSKKKSTIDEDEKKPPPVPMDYTFLDGLRGFGALSVYLSHFLLQFYDTDNTATEKQITPPDWLVTLRQTPLVVFIHGYFWVVVFFILSGFVLPLRWFRTGKASCIFGGTFRRYFRLGIPLWVNISIYYWIVKMGFTQPQILWRAKGKGFGHLMLDGLVGTWLGDNSYTIAAWTLEIELIATFFVYILAQTLIMYKGRYYLYLAVCFFIFVPQITEQNGYGFKDHKLSRMVCHFPMFFIGTCFSDLENSMKDWRPLDSLRWSNLCLCILRNLFLLLLFFTYGSFIGEHKCQQQKGVDCSYWQYATIDYHIPKELCLYVGGLAIFILALVSEGFQWVLNTGVMQFLGKISYMLYLIHCVFTEWAQTELCTWFEETKGLSQGEARMAVFLIFSPLLILVSWGLEVCVDTPSKDFANEVDQAERIERPKTEKPEDRPRCWKFCLYSWKIWALFGWFMFILITTEVYGSYDGNKERIEAEATQQMSIFKKRTSKRHSHDFRDWWEERLKP